MGIQVRQTEPLRARWDDGDVKIDALAVNVATENFSDGAGTKLVDTIRLKVAVNSRVPQLSIYSSTGMCCSKALNHSLKGHFRKRRVVVDSLDV